MSKVTTLAVRDLVAFCERRGDINFRFTSRSSAMAGIKGHQRLQRRRGEDYVAEKSVSDVVLSGEIELRIRGRADGYFPGTEPLIVEEIKTVRSNAREIPDAITRLHLAQAQVYGWLLGQAEGAGRVIARVCYLQLDNDEEVFVEAESTLEELGDCYRRMVERYLAWEIRRREWRAQRDQTINALPAPYGGFREGQRAMAVSVWRALQQSSEVVIQAPTGIGKTMASLYPALKGLASLDYDKVFFLTAKGSGQASARDAIDALRGDGLALVDVTITARDKACFNPGAACHPEQCAYASGYYDRLPGVLQAAIGESRSFTPARVSTLAEQHGMCPFELGLDLALIADVVIADYNYAFDPWVHLRRFFDDGTGRFAFLVDEAHNLVDRGRDMFSATLSKADVLRVRRMVRASAPGPARALAGVNRAILALRREHEPVLAQRRYATVSSFPVSLLKALRRFCDVAEEWLVDHGDEALLQLYFDASRFLKTAELVDEHFRCLVAEEDDEVVLQIVAVNPGPGLRAGFDRATATVAFSATLMPQPYFRELIGTREEAGWLRVDSPFPPEHLGVFATTHISTTWRDREASVDELVAAIEVVTRAKSGNYLVYLPSFAYLERVHAAFVGRNPDVLTCAQQASMREPERAAFLAGFDDPTTQVMGFAVTGGVFSEGVDLIGDRLIGVIVVGVGLPGLSVEREVISDAFGQATDPEAGFRIAYQYPGINRVLQTAGRVIRSETDRGVVCLIDQRFADARYSRLLPGEWRVNRVSSRHSLASAVDSFWGAGATSDGASICESRPDSLPDIPPDSRTGNRSGSPDGHDDGICPAGDPSGPGHARDTDCRSRRDRPTTEIQS